MEKMTTLFEKDPCDLGRVLNRLRQENKWALEDTTKQTIKFDGSACAIIGGNLYKRYDAKLNRKTGKYKPIPQGAIPCQEPDLITGHHPHWVLCDLLDNSNKYHFEAFEKLVNDDKAIDGTYELCGPKVNGNREKLKSHVLIKHGSKEIELPSFEIQDIKLFLEQNDIEGIVFHGAKGQMCKIRKTDFGISR